MDVPKMPPRVTGIKDAREMARVFTLHLGNLSYMLSQAPKVADQGNRMKQLVLIIRDVLINSLIPALDGVNAQEKTDETYVKMLHDLDDFLVVLDEAIKIPDLNVIDYIVRASLDYYENLHNSDPRTPPEKVLH